MFQKWLTGEWNRSSKNYCTEEPCEEPKQQPGAEKKNQWLNIRISFNSIFRVKKETKIRQTCTEEEYSLAVIHF